MEAAENGANYGGGCWVACFLRQEKRAPREPVHRKRLAQFTAWRNAHLFIHTFTVGPTFKDTARQPTEWQAMRAILEEGFSARSGAGSVGVQHVIATVRDQSLGTVHINSGNYIARIGPDGLLREETLAGENYLPGVHLIMVIPLVTISMFAELASSSTA
jgi:hypothetical protein